MTDVVAWLTAQIDVDQAAALAAAASIGHDHHGMGCEMSDEDAAHIALHRPARALADVAAKRAIVALHGPESEPAEVSYCKEDGHHRHPCPTLRHLALAYHRAGVPGFREDWRP